MRGDFSVLRRRPHKPTTPLYRALRACGGDRLGRGGGRGYHRFLFTSDLHFLDVISTVRHVASSFVYLCAILLYVLSRKAVTFKTKNQICSFMNIFV